MNSIGSQSSSVTPEVWEDQEMRNALAAREVSTIYKLLRRKGVSQRQIAAMTGQSQSEVSEILKGRQVMAYDVLVRIADGLGVPRGYMGLAYDEVTAARVAETREAPEAEEPENVKRRKFLAHAAAVAVGAHVLGADSGSWVSNPVLTPAPGRIGMTDVRQVEAATRALRSLDYQYGGGFCRDAVVAQLSWGQQMLSASGLRRGQTTIARGARGPAQPRRLDVVRHRPDRLRAQPLRPRARARQGRRLQPAGGQHPVPDGPGLPAQGGPGRRAEDVPARPDRRPGVRLRAGRRGHLRQPGLGLRDDGPRGPDHEAHRPHPRRVRPGGRRRRRGLGQVLQRGRRLRHDRHGAHRAGPAGRRQAHEVRDPGADQGDRLLRRRHGPQQGVQPELRWPPTTCSTATSTTAPRSATRPSTWPNTSSRAACGTG